MKETELPPFAVILIIVTIIAVIGTLYISDVIHETHEKEIELIPETAIPFYPEGNMILLDTYKTSVPYGITMLEANVYKKIYVIHDNKRNVTCYLYDNGINCIHDCYIGNQNV